MFKYTTNIIIIILLTSCLEKPDPQKIIDQTIEKHGSLAFKENKVTFDFRNKHYTVEYLQDNKIYTRSYKDDSLGNIKDVLTNSNELKRYVNDTLVSLNSEWQQRYSNSVNSVLYFFQLPFGLNDLAVNKEYIGEQYINNKDYHKIKITFNQEGGGEDYQDVFIYWINKASNTIDYLAYSYATDEGGSRFRQAINRRKINNMIFQDYVNYKPSSKELSVEKLDDQFKEGKLLELSRIVNENISIN